MRSSLFLAKAQLDSREVNGQWRVHRENSKTLTHTSLFPYWFWIPHFCDPWRLTFHQCGISLQIIRDLRFYFFWGVRVCERIIPMIKNNWSILLNNNNITPFACHCRKTNLFICNSKLSFLGWIVEAKLLFLIMFW